MYLEATLEFPGMSGESIFLFYKVPGEAKL